MKVKSSPVPTQHVLVALMNYGVNPKSHEFNKYGFGYVQLDNCTIQQINQYHQNWKNAERKQERQHIQLNHSMLLIEADYVIEKAHGNCQGFEHIKLDSISFLDSSPSLDSGHSYATFLNLVCDSDYFVIEAERIPDGLHYATIIYRSTRISYQKIDSLLQTQA